MPQWIRLILTNCNGNFNSRCCTALCAASHITVFAWMRMSGQSTVAMRKRVMMVLMTITTEAATAAPFPGAVGGASFAMFVGSRMGC